MLCKGDARFERKNKIGNENLIYYAYVLIEFKFECPMFNWSFRSHRQQRRANKKLSKWKVIITLKQSRYNGNRFYSKTLNVYFYICIFFSKPYAHIWFKILNKQYLIFARRTFDQYKAVTTRKRAPNFKKIPQYLNWLSVMGQIWYYLKIS